MNKGTIIKNLNSFRFILALATILAFAFSSFAAQAADSDQDNLSDDYEIGIGTDPYDTNTDDDGLDDYFEVMVWFTNPLSADPDGDGLDDYQEAVALGTNPNFWDTDNDGLGDGYEVQYGLDPFQVDIWNDLDSDGIVNIEEQYHGGYPNDPDTDDDGLNDGLEVAFGSWVQYPDIDQDNLLDSEEYTNGTNPHSGDTDGDSKTDYDEIYVYFSDPLVPD